MFENRIACDLLHLLSSSIGSSTTPCSWFTYPACADMPNSSTHARIASFRIFHATAHVIGTVKRAEQDVTSLVAVTGQLIASLVVCMVQLVEQDIASLGGLCGTTGYE